MTGFLIKMEMCRRREVGETFSFFFWQWRTGIVSLQIFKLWQLSSTRVRTPTSTKLKNAFIARGCQKLLGSSFDGMAWSLRSWLIIINSNNLHFSAINSANNLLPPPLKWLLVHSTKLQVSSSLIPTSLKLILWQLLPFCRGNSYFKDGPVSSPRSLLPRLPVADALTCVLLPVVKLSC